MSEGDKKNPHLFYRLIICFSPYIILYLLYEDTRAIVARMGGVISFGLPMKFELYIFGTVLSKVFYMHRNIVFDWIMFAVYALHPLYLLIFAFIIFAVDRKLFPPYTVYTAIAAVTAIIVYTIWPVAPPWLSVPGLDRPQNPLVILASKITGRPYYDPNPYAAMPSMHVGMAIIYAYIAANSKRIPGGKIHWTLPLLMSIAVIYTANHYLLDVIAGVIVAVASILVGNKLLEREKGLIEKFNRYCHG